ncbi:ATP-binding protein [Burkholderia territorii]|uniref:ATP-binding protein n=1 Tax=Burkholderia territorii TaxID=1503055 RepID=UPI002ED863C8
MSMLNRNVGVLIACAVIGLLPAWGWAEDKPRFTSEEQAWIAAHPVVRTYANPNWRPFEFRKAGRVVGIVPSYLDAIARISGLRFEYVDDVTWRNSYDALMSGKIDVAPSISKTFDHSRYRDPGIIVGQPYFVGTVIVVASKRLNIFVDFHKLAGRRVAIMGGGGLEYAFRNGPTPVTLLTYDDDRDALAAVADGNADVAIGADMSLLPLLRRQFQDQLYVSGGLADRPYALAMATRRDMALLASILDKSLRAIPARDSEEIPRRWIESADYGKPTLRSIYHYRRWQVITAGAIVLGLIVVTVIVWRSRVAAIRSERDKAMFLAFISHEIRTPMHTILSSLELLQHSDLTPKQANRADAAVAASESLLTLLNDILEYSRLESRGVTLSLEPTDIVRWTKDCAEMVRWRIEGKPLELSLELACHPELHLLIDPVRTRQIALNLLVNAIKFTSSGSIVLRIDYLQDRRKGLGSLVIEVRDTGAGIPPERQRSIFEPYQRVEEPRNRRVNGSGLGLAICRELVDLMNGVVTVSSSLDKGTIFTVILPVRRCDAPRADVTTVPQESTAERAAQSWRSEAFDAAELQRSLFAPSILVVDDHEAVQHAIQHQLDALECRSAIAGTGERAIDLFERTRYDIVLLDCDLPDIDGYTVARRMRSSEQARGQGRVPIIAISASAADVHRERCFESGMDGLLGKPIRLQELRQMIELWCRPNTGHSTTLAVSQSHPAQVDLFTIYKRSTDEDLAKLAETLSRNDTDGARRAVHRIKGAAAIVGHASVSELAAEMERLLSDTTLGTSSEIEALHGKLLRLYNTNVLKPETP